MWSQTLLRIFAGFAGMGTDHNILCEGALRRSNAMSQGDSRLDLPNGHDARDQAKVSERETCRPPSF